MRRKRGPGFSFVGFVSWSCCTLDGQLLRGDDPPGWVVWWLLRGSLACHHPPHDPSRPVKLRELERGVYAHGDRGQRLLVVLNHAAAVDAGSGVLDRTEVKVEMQRIVASLRMLYYSASIHLVPVISSRCELTYRVSRRFNTLSISSLPDLDDNWMYLETIGGKWAQSLSSQGGMADGRRPPKRAELVGNPWCLGDIEGAEDGATRGRGVMDIRRAAEDFWLLRLMMVAGELFWSYMVDMGFVCEIRVRRVRGLYSVFICVEAMHTR
ncbi:uncharacterized protein BDZ83DRAFT_139089 [Colletotrichum acutatum]|uniref:Uncharacterized protein n=1 Tax=Glomerella acutata TaxID=27357 RepID=A0AAD8UTN8_GLOAC|nr:uncharacterized protein BDZ83DRAFT_139089 [Colletotrichum acutatum]KAK1728300.1 hypothetical protein BDZ83DRAFT_139089 [Colletotrichum acutatum]